MRAHAATIIPTNVEKLPLYHWRPGARLLSVGSRDGAHFHGDRTADANTYLRQVVPEQLREASGKLRLDGMVATWAGSLHEAAGIDAILAAAPAHLVIATPGIGDAAVLQRLLPVVDAWLLLAPADPGPLATTILEQGRHVEVLVGLSGGAVPELPWQLAGAVHLVAERPAEADRLETWISDARPRFSAGLAVYDHHHVHTDCACGERLVWRAGGRSRLDAHDPATNRCRACGRPSVIRS